MKKIICLVSLLSLLYFVRITLYAEDMVVYNYANSIDISQIFNRNEVLITLSNEESNLEKEYTIDDFPELDCVSVDELTYPCDDNTNFKRIFKITLEYNGTEYILDAVNKLSMREEIYNVEPNYIFEIDDYNISQSNSNMTRNVSTTFDKNWGYEMIEAELANGILSDLQGGVCSIGVIENGIDSSHDALQYKFYTWLSKDFSNNTNPQPFIDSGGGHGTEVTGIINASSNNSGMIGVNPNIPIVSLKTNAYEQTYDGVNYTSVNIEQIIRCVEHARINDIRILNCSFGFHTFSLSLMTAMSQYQGLIVCGSGNSYNNIDEEENYIYPACYDLDNIITVGAIDINKNIWNETEYIEGAPFEYGSNYGENNVDVFAPGVDIYTTTLNNGYDYRTGTSYAVPYVSALASMITAVYRQTHDYEEISTDELKEIIMDNVTLEGGLEEFCKSGGYINAKDSLLDAANIEITYQYLDYNADYHLTTPNYGASFYEPHSWVIFSGWNFPYAFRPASWICEKCLRVKFS